MLGVRFLLACLKISSKLPYRVLMGMGAVAGRIIFVVARRRRAIAATNLKLCFPELTTDERRKLLHRHFSALGRALFESGLAYYAAEEKLRPLLQLDGLQNLESALARGHGVILVAGHFTSMELCGRLLGLEADYDVVIRPFSNADVDAIVDAGRHRAVKHVIPKKNFKQFLRGLKANRAILITVDQATTASNRVMARFFGVPAATSVNAARIALKTGAAVLPVLWLREADMSGYRVEIGEPMARFPTGDALTDANRINSLIEDQVRLAPEQYYWIHRRFKNEPSPYERRPKC
jgi:KDO2-lipid IV(A) lauroyltransferase